MEMGMDLVGQEIVTHSLHKMSQDDSYGIMDLNRISDFEGVYRNLHIVAVIIGGVFVLIAPVLSTLLILQHLRSYNNPAEQKWIIGVLFMVPVYAAESMAIATVAHVYIFPVEPYRFLCVPECEEVTSVDPKPSLRGVKMLRDSLLSLNRLRPGCCSWRRQAFKDVALMGDRAGTRWCHKDTRNLPSIFGI